MLAFDFKQRLEWNDLFEHTAFSKIIQIILDFIKNAANKVKNINNLWKLGEDMDPEEIIVNIKKAYNNWDVFIIQI